MGESYQIPKARSSKKGILRWDETGSTGGLIGYRWSQANIDEAARPEANLKAMQDDIIEIFRDSQKRTDGWSANSGSPGAAGVLT